MQGRCDSKHSGKEKNRQLENNCLFRWVVKPTFSGLIF